MNYNLLEEPWIPVLMRDGRHDRVGIRTALLKARHIRQIAASNPMDNVALLRLLLAVLHWCKPSLTEEDRKRLGSAEGIPEEWLNEKLGTPDAPSAAFRLLGGSGRFFQHKPQAREKPNRRVSDLFAYFPAATEINHFRHVCDRTIALCPACCAVGLVRLPACAMQGGQGKSPSINNAPPVYFVPVGESLLETLQLNWPLQGADADDHPAWQPGKPSGEIGLLEGFTWQPRAVWLGPLVEHVSRKCARCGAAGPLVSQLVFKKGRSRKGDGRAWRDPHVAWSRTKKRGDDEGSGVKDRTLRGPDPLKYPSFEARLWRESARAVLESGGNNPPFESVMGAKQRLSQSSYLRVACFEPFTRQAKAFDEHRDAWSTPTGLLQRADIREAALGEIRRLNDLNVSTSILRALPRNTKARPEVRSAVAMVAAHSEHRLRKCFRTFLNDLPEADTDEKAEACVKRWRSDVRHVFREALDRACSVIAVGSPLRRREAVESAQRELHQALKKLADTKSRGPTAGAGEKTRGSRRKGGTA
jgi:CRISPR type I-E-associated protein CasA/Cse1